MVSASELIWWGLPGALFVLGATVLTGKLARRRALREVDVPAPTAEEIALAWRAGVELAAKGPLALVLAGGGAKGAYQAGCWSALRDCGVMEFGAIAGTSVGALNAVLVAQNDFAKAQAVWHDMNLGRVLRLHWYCVAAVLIRVVLIVPYLIRLVYPTRFIPVSVWRALRTFRQGGREGDPVLKFKAAFTLYGAFIQRPDSSDIVGWAVLAGILGMGLSGWWLLAAPVLELVAAILVAPLAVFLLISCTSWLVSALNFVSTRLVLATNMPLHQLVCECIDLDRLRGRSRPLFVTLASLGVVTRKAPVLAKSIPSLGEVPRDGSAVPTPILLLGEVAREAPVVTAPILMPVQAPPLVAAAAAKQSRWKRFFAVGESGYHKLPSGPGAPFETTTVEYVPKHVEVRASEREVDKLILQSAGLPEIFPARRIGGETYVDGGMADNVPLAAVAGLPGHAAIIVVPLDSKMDECAVLKNLKNNLERLGRSPSVSLPELVLLTPSRPLGGSFTGTLDFSATRARALMHLGYCDTIRHFAGRWNKANSPD